MAETFVVVAACLTGGLGAVLRHLTDTAVRRRVGEHSTWGTWLVNVVGSLVAGVLAGAVAGWGEPAAGRTTVVLALGLLGGYTTFSTSVVQSLAVGGRHGGWHGLGHAVGTWSASVLAAAVGLGLGVLLAG